MPRSSIGRPSRSTHTPHTAAISTHTAAPGRSTLATMSAPSVADHDPFPSITAALAEARRDHAALLERHAADADTIASLRMAVDASAEDAAVLRAELQRSQEAEAELRATLGRLSEEQAILATRIEQRERALATSEEQATTAQRAQQRAEERTEELEAALARRDDALENATKEERTRGAALAAAQDEIRSLRDQRDAAQQEAERAHVANASLRAKVSEREERLADVSRRVNGQAGAASCTPPFTDVSNLVAPSPAASGATAPSPAAAAAAPPPACATDSTDACAAVHFARVILAATRTDSTGGTLEEVAARLFRIGLGYTCDRVGGSHDRGIDLRMRSADDLLTVAQCKSRKSGDVPFVDVSAFIGAMGLSGASHGFFVTNSSFTREARRAAAEWASGAGGFARSLTLFSSEELTALLTKHHRALASDLYLASLLENPGLHRLEHAAAAPTARRGRGSTHAAVGRTRRHRRVTSRGGRGRGRAAARGAAALEPPSGDAAPRVR